MDNQKVRAVLAYLFSPIGAIIVLLVKDSTKKTRFHAAQALTLIIAYMIASFVAAFIQLAIVNGALSICYLVLMILGIVRAAGSEENDKLPYIGDWAESIFKKQIEEGPDDVPEATTAEASNENAENVEEKTEETTNQTEE